MCHWNVRRFCVGHLMMEGELFSVRIDVDGSLERVNVVQIVD